MSSKSHDTRTPFRNTSVPRFASLEELDIFMDDERERERNHSILLKTEKKSDRKVRYVQPKAPKTIKPFTATMMERRVNIHRESSMFFISWEQGVCFEGPFYHPKDAEKHAISVRVNKYHSFRVIPEFRVNREVHVMAPAYS